MKFHHILAALALSLAALNASALDIEPYWGFGLTGDPLVSGIAEYNYSDGSSKKLVAGRGLGVLIGSEVFSTGPFEFNLKGGFQYNSMSGTLTTGEERSDTFLYFPVIASVYYDISRRFSIGLGASYLIKPTYYLTFDGEKESLNGDNSLGFTTELRYVAIESKVDSSFEAFYVLRYTQNNVKYTTYTDTDGTEWDLVENAYDDEKVRSLQLGLTLRY